MSRRLAFLDRDGILSVPLTRNGKGYAPRSLQELQLYPDIRSSVFRLKRLGFEVVVVTNQPDVAAGIISRAELEAINVEVVARSGVARVRVCPHAREEFCRCRKPRPGLLQAENEFGPVNFAESWMVGDRDSDLSAGNLAGCRTVFVNRGWRAESGLQACFAANDLGEAVALIEAVTIGASLECNENPKHRDICRRCFAR